MGKLLNRAIAFWVMAILNIQPASAILLELVPSSATVAVGDPVNVDVVISGLTAGGPPSVGAFDLNVSFDESILSPITVTFGPFLGDPMFEALTDFSFSTPGLVNFAEVSLLPASDLDALQPSSFSLATLSFIATSNGTSQFTFVGDRRVDDAFGNKLLIPEPTTLALLFLGLLAYLRLNYSGKNLLKLLKFE